MKNHWTAQADYKKKFREVTDALSVVWGNDGTFGEFLEALTDEQMALIFRMKIDDAAAAEFEEIGFTLRKA